MKELTKEQFIQDTYSIFENTKRIHGNSDAIDWMKVASHKTATYFSDAYNLFSERPEYTEPPLELKICTHCSKEFKSNIDCPVCPSCYL